MTPLLKAGLCQAASDALRAAGFTSNQISQTIGNAAASAGTHAADGFDQYGNHYCAAVDISVNHPIALDESQILFLVKKLWDVGFIPFYRNPGHDHWPKSDAKHIHALWPGVYMKSSLQRQCHDAFEGKNGLASHAVYIYNSDHKLPTPVQKAQAQRLFFAYNPTQVGGPKPTLPKQTLPTDVVKLGDSGERIVDIQTRLHRLGLYNGPIDGDFGPMTEAAVKAFQQTHGIQLTLQVGPTTLAMLDKLTT